MSEVAAPAISDHVTVPREGLVRILNFAKWVSNSDRPYIKPDAVILLVRELIAAADSGPAIDECEWVRAVRATVDAYDKAPGNHPVREFPLALNGLRALLATRSPPAVPKAVIGYAVRMADGNFVGIWQDAVLAKSICARQPKTHGDRVIAVCEASGE
jgi:hypothetical protein